MDDSHSYKQKEWFLNTTVHTILTNTNNTGINLPNGFAKALAHNNSCSRQNHEVCTFPFSDTNSLRASSPIWVSEVSLARTREPAPRGFPARSRVLARLGSLAQRRACSQARVKTKCATHTGTLSSSCMTQMMATSKPRILALVHSFARIIGKSTDLSKARQECLFTVTILT